MGLTHRGDGSVNLPDIELEPPSDLAASSSPSSRNGSRVAPPIGP